MGPLYHGTNTLAAAEIERNGFVIGPRNGSHSDGAIWLTPSYEAAKRFAETSAQIHGGEPVVYEIPSITGVPATEVGYLDLDMALEAGADYSPQGPEVAVMNPEIIREMHRVASVKKTASSMVTVYRGIQVYLDKKATVDILAGVKRGNVQDAITKALAGNGREAWWSVGGAQDSSGAGRWWSSSLSAASGYAGGYRFWDGQSYFGMSVILSAEVDDDVWGQYADGDNRGVYWYRVPEGLPLTITKIEATVPSRGQVAEMETEIAYQEEVVGKWGGTEEPSFSSPESEVSFSPGIRTQSASLEDWWDMSGDEPRWVQPRPELLKDALYEWKGSNSSLAIWMNHALEDPNYLATNGTAKIWKAQAQAIIEEVRSGKTAPRLYRGDTRQPVGFLGWSENLRTARRFAKMGGGQVWVIPAGVARGICIRDYAPGSGLDEDEMEWIIETTPGVAQPMGDQ